MTLHPPMKALEADGFCIWWISLPPKVLHFLSSVHMLNDQCFCQPTSWHAILLLGCLSHDKRSSHEPNV